MTGRFRIAKGWRDMKTIAYLTLDTLFWSKKTIFVVFISLVVLGMAVLGRLVLSYNWIRAPFTPAQVFSTLMSTAVIHFMVVFVTLFYGTALISEEVEGKTLTYLFLRPIPKPAIMVGKYLALVWTSVLLVLPTVVFSYLILYLRDDLRPFWEDAGVLGKDIGIVFLALLAYGAFFSLLGAWLKHPILAGLIYAFGWEGIVHISARKCSSFLGHALWGADTGAGGCEYVVANDRIVSRRGLPCPERKGVCPRTIGSVRSSGFSLPGRSERRFTPDKRA